MSDDLVERLARFLCNCWGDEWSDGKRFHVANAKVIMDMVAPEITRLRTELAEAEARGYRRALEDAAVACEVEADKCDDAAKWGESRQYVADCKAASYAMRDRAYAIRKMGEKG